MTLSIVTQTESVTSRTRLRSGNSLRNKQRYRGWAKNSDSFITNCFLKLTVKNFENRLIFGEIMRYTKMVPFRPPCTCSCKLQFLMTWFI